MKTVAEKIRGVDSATKDVLTGVNDFIKGVSGGEAALKSAGGVMTSLSGALGKICPILGMANGILSAFGVFGSDPFQQEVLQEFKKVNEKLDNLEKDMDTRFDNLSNLVNLDFKKLELSNAQRYYNDAVGELPVSYPAGGTGSTTGDDKTWQAYIGINENPSGQVKFYTDIMGKDIYQAMSDVVGVLTGLPNAPLEQSSVALSLLGILTDKAIYQMGTDGLNLKGITKRGCVSSSAALLEHYISLESFFYKNFMLQTKTYSMWYDATIYTNAMPYPIDADEVKDDQSNIDAIINKDKTEYRNIEKMQNFICVGKLADKFNNSTDAITKWDEGILQKNTSYTKEQYAKYFAKYKNGTLTYVDEGSTKPAPLFLFVNKVALIEVMEARENLKMQLDLFVFQMERLVVSQANFLCNYADNASNLEEYLKTGATILGRAEFLRQSLLGNTYDPNYPNAGLFVGRVLLPNTSSIASVRNHLSGSNFGTFNEVVCQYGYGYDTKKTGYGYQFPILTTAGIQPYTDSWLKMAHLVIPNTGGATYAGLDIDLGFTGNTLGPAEAKAFTFDFDCGNGGTTTIYSLYYVALFWSFDAKKALLPNTRLSASSTRNWIYYGVNEYPANSPVSQAVWISVDDINSKIQANTDGAWSKFGLVAHNSPGNEADYNDVATLTIALSTPFESQGRDLYVWIEAYLTINIDFDTNKRFEEVDLVFSCPNNETISRAVFRDEDSHEYAAANRADIGPFLLGNNHTIAINTGNLLEQPLLDSDLHSITIPALVKIPSESNKQILWSLTARGGPNVGAGIDFTFGGQIMAQLTVNELRLFWDMPDVTKF